MATLVLSAAGGSAAGSVGQFVGAQLGGYIDQTLFSGDDQAAVRGPRLKDLEVQVSTYGKMLPILYGTARIAGNVIWSRPIRETATTSQVSTGGGKGGGGFSGGGSRVQTRTETSYSYSATMAISLCEGAVDEVLRVYANGKAINPNALCSSYTVYRGSETQLPDSVIESYEGAGRVPAYRGQAYVVLEDLQLASFGNRIPNLSFEVKRKQLLSESNETPVEEMIESLVMIPGSGEFVYDDTVQFKKQGENVGGSFIQKGYQERINQHSLSGKCDALTSLDQMQETLPNVEWVAVVVTWFGTSIDAATCGVYPGVEYQAGADTAPDSWSVAGFNRATARLLTQIDGAPIYGGTPSDASLVRYLQELKSRGYNILFYPMIFMDISTKPWRGRITGSVSEVADFFTRTNGYNAFVNHYASLVKDEVDGFVIGSELVGLTSVQDESDDSFPAVDALVSLASSVKSTVGSGVKVTYAADWSEYHHEANGWYHLDPLWASSDIDMVGIDAYFPLADSVQDSSYNVQTLIDGWTEGEGYDWYYSDAERTVQTSLSQEYAWKNLAWWWENTHTNPDASTSAWVPESKPIWFTEYGFPSVDGAANQPNVFVDASSSESAYPYHSKKQVDFRAQRAAITATELKWKDSAMVERQFLWTWDARPFPFWPDLTNVWSDGNLWRTGHWVQGKLGQSGLASIVENLANSVGLESSDIDVSRLKNLVDGFVLSEQSSIKDVMNALRAAYFFDVVESGGQLVFVPRGNNAVLSVTEDELIAQSKNSSSLMLMTRQQEVDLPQKMDVIYYDKAQNYQLGTQHAQRISGVVTKTQASVKLPLILSEQEAKHLAEVTLYHRWLGRTEYNFTLPNSYLMLEPTDIIDVTVSGVTHSIRIREINQIEGSALEIKGVAEDVLAYQFNVETASEISAQTESEELIGKTHLEILDLPAFPSDTGEVGYTRFAMVGLEEGWQGATIYRGDDENNYQPLINAQDAAVVGVASDVLEVGSVGIVDKKK